MLVFTSAAAISVQQFQLSYIPQFLIYDDGGDPHTFVRVEDQELGVIVDLPAAGTNEFRRFMRYGVVANDLTLLRLANGHIRNRNVTVTVSNAAVAAVSHYACSDAPGDVAMKYQSAALLAGQPTIFEDFTALALPGLAAADTVHVTFSNGHQQLFNPPELLELASLYQTDQGATRIFLNNINSYIKRAVVTQAIVGTAYVMKVNI